MALKCRSSELDDVIVSSGPLRRIHHKANIFSERDNKELEYTVFQQDWSSPNLVLPNETKPEVLGYASVPAKSTQTANKILQHLEKPSPKEKNVKQSVSSHTGMREKSPNKLITSDMLHGQALRSLEKVNLPKFLPSPRDIQKAEAQSKDKAEGNVSRKFPVPYKLFTSVNGDSTDSLKDKAPSVGFTGLPLKFQEEPQKKRAFQMRASEDAVEIDDGIHDNGHMSFPLAKYNKLETSVVDNIKTPALPEVSKTHTLVENNSPVLPAVAKVPAQAEVKEAEKATSFPNTDGFLGGFVREQALGLKIPISSSSTTATHSSVLLQSTLQMEKIAPNNNPSSFSFVTTAEKVPPVPFSASKPSEFKPNAVSDLKPLHSISVNGNGNDQKSANIIGRSESSIPAVPTNGNLLFGIATKNLSAPNMTPASNPTTLSPLAPFPNPASSSATISTTTTTATSAAIISTSVPPPVFSFGSALTAPTTSVAETGNAGSISPFAITSFSTTDGSGLFGFSSPSATLTTTPQSQGSFFNISNGSQTNTQASSSSTLFGSSAPAFGSAPSSGMGPLVPFSETKSSNSTSGFAASIFGSTWQQPQTSSGFSSSPSSSVFTVGAPSTPTHSFATGSAANSSFAGAPVFGKSTPTFGVATTSPNNNNNDQMSMEDSMAEDSMQTHSSDSPFGQALVGAPGFMFSSATPTLNPNPAPSVAPFQFDGQSNQAPLPQNPFQSSSLEFNAGGGSFSLGSGGEKSNRRMVRITKRKK